jgi:hypothetical protein
MEIIGCEMAGPDAGEPAGQAGGWLGWAQP